MRNGDTFFLATDVPIDVVRFLVENGGDVNAPDKLLYWAVEEGYYRWSEFSMEQGTI